MYMKNPEGIETKSFAIIREEMGDKVNLFSEEEMPIVQRVIHTTADFEYADLIRIHPHAIEVIRQALMAGEEIYADTSMIATAVNRRKMAALSSQVHHYVHDKDVRDQAQKEGITRSMAAIEKAMRNDQITIYAIGNAPTAIYRLKELIESTGKKPKAIVGAPVGFVGAAESKEVLMEMDIPYISIKGRKGGSPVVAAIFNAILKGIDLQ
jgi:precorrin-8X/cobalt-precorrin-8 methylmutase